MPMWLFHADGWRDTRASPGESWGFGTSSIGRHAGRAEHQGGQRKACRILSAARIGSDETMRACCIILGAWRACENSAQNSMPRNQCNGQETQGASGPVYLDSNSI